MVSWSLGGGLPGCQGLACTVLGREFGRGAAPRPPCCARGVAAPAHRLRAGAPNAPRLPGPGTVRRRTVQSPSGPLPTYSWRGREPPATGGKATQGGWQAVSPPRRGPDRPAGMGLRFDQARSCSLASRRAVASPWGERIPERLLLGLCVRPIDEFPDHTRGVVAQLVLAVADDTCVATRPITDRGVQWCPREIEEPPDQGCPGAAGAADAHRQPGPCP